MHLAWNASQENVAPLSIADMYDFERLFGRASHGLSLSQLDQ